MRLIYPEVFNLPNGKQLSNIIEYGLMFDISMSLCYGKKPKLEIVEIPSLKGTGCTIDSQSLFRGTPYFSKTSYPILSSKNNAAQV